MKIKPVADALEARGVDVVLVHTGQHYDHTMNDVFFEELGLRLPDHSLGVGSGTYAQQASRVMTTFEPLLADVLPDVIVVVGDVNSTVACALVGAQSGALVAHVEAGLRSRDWAMPEEINRVVTDRLSDFLFTPSADAAENLCSEGYHRDQVHVVGNVMVDTLLANLERARERPILDSLAISPGQFGLVTLQRPASVDDPSSLMEILRGLSTVAGRCPLIFPVHPRTRQGLPKAALPGITIIDPLGYLDFVALEASAALVLTDSGGVQEETSVLGTPCLTLRDNTERPITVTHGTNTVVGRSAEAIVSAADAALVNPRPERRLALWDGHAADRIADVVATADRTSPPPRPTERMGAPKHVR
jgi:UDP-N-acetylglucosamine 2-epimerase (non-hydrolysing)